MNDIVDTQTGTRPQGDGADILASGGRIVVGVDGSAASKEALRAAARIAVLTGSTIDAVGVWDYPLTYGYAQGQYAPIVAELGSQSDWSPENDARKMLIATVDEVFGPDRPVGLGTTLLRGHAAKRLLKQAEGASLVVVGSRGHGAFTGLMLGSVSMKAAAAASCPVLIVHAPAQDSPDRS